jgi:hypothetical protein
VTGGFVLIGCAVAVAAGAAFADAFAGFVINRVRRP